jgi:hypothetical protein
MKGCRDLSSARCVCVPASSQGFHKHLIFNADFSEQSNLPCWMPQRQAQLADAE